MAEPFLAEIRLFSFGFAPKGWALCNGQTLQINQNQALFSILGTTFGGDGRVTFGLPNLQGRIPLHTGNGFNLGQRAGEEAHTIVSGETPTHGHLAMADPNNGTVTSALNGTWAKAGIPNTWNVFSGSANVAMAQGTVSSVGGSQAHENRSPYLTINFCIALQGIFPSPN